MNRAELCLCPDCHSLEIQVASTDIRCAGCSKNFAIEDGVWDFRIDRTLDTQLDLNTYDEQHHISESASLSIFQLYEKAFEYGKVDRRGRALEIGSGTGNLTTALVRHSRFQEIHCSDISLRFMKRLTEKLGAPQILHRYLFDANFLPFRSGVFDVVVGHSILHHLMHFEKTVSEAHRVLRSGGVAVFGEPMIETNALVYLAAAQILKCNSLLPTSMLSPVTAQALDTISGWGERVMSHLSNRNQSVAAEEDKFIFPSNYMRELAERCGFSSYQLMQYAPVGNLAEVVKRELDRILRGTKAVVDEIDYFRPIIDSFESYRMSLGPYTSQTFAFNVFIK